MKNNMKLSAIKSLRFAALAPLALCVALGATPTLADIQSGQYTYADLDGTAYFDTGYYVKSNSVFRFKMASRSSAAYQNFFADFVDGNTQVTRVMVNNTSATDYVVDFFSRADVGTIVKGVVSARGNPVEGVLAYSYVILNGTRYTPTKTTAPASTATMKIGGRGNNAGHASRFWYFTIEEDGEVVHDYVPYSENGKSGIKDLVTDDFLENASSGGTVTLTGWVPPSYSILDVSSSLEGIGSPSPAYGETNGLEAADSFSVSCGATPVANAAGTIQYSCTGWKLYDDANAVVSNGVETSFTYVHPTPSAYRRLEWQWEVTAYHGTIAAGHGGAVSQSGAGWYAVGTPVTVTATPNAGYGFQRWTGTLPEGVSATSASVTFTPTAPFSMTAIFETVGNGGLVFFNEKTSSYWHTATNCVIDLPIEFPDGASSATLSVTGIGYLAQYAISAGMEQYTLSLPPATSSTAENVYDLALAFNDSASTVRTAKLGLIYGHDATTTGWTRCLAPAGTRAWSKTKGVAVIPIPYGTTSFTITLDGGEATSTDTGLDGAAGWYPLRLKGETTADLAATTLEGSLSASLRGDGAGFFLIVR